MKVTFYGPSFSCFGIAEATAVVWVFIISLLLSGFLYSAELSFFFYFYVYVHKGKNYFRELRPICQNFIFCSSAIKIGALLMLMRYFL